MNVEKVRAARIHSTVNMAKCRYSVPELGKLTRRLHLFVISTKGAV